MQITTKNYTKLLLEIRKTIKQTEENVVALVNYEKVKMSWKVGEKIEDFVRKNSKPEDLNTYGKKIIERLTQDTGINRLALYQMHAFYKTYKTLPSPEKKLNWSHYRNLISVKDDTKRLLLEDLVVKNNLSSKKLQDQVAKVNKKSKKKNYVLTKLRCLRGRLFTYKMFDKSRIDLGFNIFLSSPVKSKITLTTKSDYTYKASLERVVDGDTIHVTLDLGFGISHHEILRLAQIEAAEAGTKEGKKATRFLQETLRGVPFLIVKTNKTDIYGRYVADIFFDKKISDPQIIAEKGTHLNQLLLDCGVVTAWKSKI
jgi:endonuclease YncB( thermonuclease family)